MPESTYKVIELIGTSEESWEQAARNAIERAAQSLKNLRIAEITKLDLRIEDNRVVAYRARVNLSFKYEAGLDDYAPPPAARAPKATRRKR